MNLANDEVELPFSKPTNSIVSIDSGHDFMPAPAKHRLDGLPNVLIVFGTSPPPVRVNCSSKR